MCRLLYAVINVGVYGYLHTPLNARMFKLVGQLGNMRSSIVADERLYGLMMAPGVNSQMSPRSIGK